MEITRTGMSNPNVKKVGDTIENNTYLRPLKILTTFMGLHMNNNN